MGAIVSRLANSPFNQGLKRAMKRSYFTLGNIWFKYAHPLVHYSLVPGIIAYGLYQANELTLNPLELLNKVFVP